MLSVAAIDDVVSRSLESNKQLPFRIAGFEDLLPPVASEGRAPPDPMVDDEVCIWTPNFSVNGSGT